MFSCLATVIQQPWKGQNLSLSSDSFLFGFFFCCAGNQIQGLGMQDKRAKPHPQPSWFFFQQLLWAHFWAYHSQFSMGRVQTYSHLSCLQTCCTEDTGMEDPGTFRGRISSQGPLYFLYGSHFPLAFWILVCRGPSFFTSHSSQLSSWVLGYLKDEHKHT